MNNLANYESQWKFHLFLDRHQNKIISFLLKKKKDNNKWNMGIEWMNYRKGIRTNKKMICSAILYMRVYYMFMYICNLYNKVLNVTFPMCVAQMLIYYFIFIFFLNIPSMLPNYFENQCKLYISGSVHNNHTQTISKQWNMIFFL